jgi:uncharacterized GH25 family protein
MKNKHRTGSRRVVGTIVPAVVFLLLLVPLSQVSAHSLYIQSTRYAADKGKSLPLFFCYGHHVPVADGIRGKKLKQVQIIAPDGTVSEAAIRDDTSLHSYMVNYDTPGTWILAAETTPGFFTMYTDKKGRDRHAIKPMDHVREEAVEIHKSYYSRQFAKAYVSCESPSNDFPARAGLFLELSPVEDIFGLKAGETLALDVYMDGEPYTGEGVWDATYMGFSTESEDHFHPKTPVTGSRLSIPIPNPGRWFVRYAVTVPAPEKDRDKYMQMKLTTTLTFQIDNARKTPETDSH